MKQLTRIILVLSFLVAMTGHVCAENGQEYSSDKREEFPVFGFNLSASELSQRGYDLYEAAVTWDESSVPQNLGDFPILPDQMYIIEQETEALRPSLFIFGRKAVWTSEAERICDGNYGKITYNRIYGYSESGEDIDFIRAKWKANTFESFSAQNASDVYYVRQEREWLNEGWKYRFSVDFFEAKRENGDRITDIGMYNPENKVDFSWQINSEMKNCIMIDVNLNKESRFFSLEYDINTGELTDYRYSE